MKDFIEHAPQIIEQAAKSTLGILALMVLVLAVLSLIFFKNAPVKIRIAIFITLFIGVVGFAAVVAHQTAVVSNPKLIGPESAIVGNWIQTHEDTNKIKYATVRIRLAPSSSAFELNGWTYGLSDQDIELLVFQRSEWSSLVMAVRPHAGNLEAVYSYSARIKVVPLQIVDGFGTITFACRKDGTCNRATGYYIDTQIKNPVTFKMRRVRNEFDNLFSNNPEELIKRYHKSPNAVTVSDNGA